MPYEIDHETLLTARNFKIQKK